MQKMKAFQQNNKMKRLVPAALSLMLVACLLASCNGGNEQQSSVPSDSQSSSQNVQPQSQAPSSNSADVGLEQAQAAALKDAGLEEGQVTFTKGKLEWDDGVQQYEIEFVDGTMKYEYEIKAADGSVMQSSQEPIEQIPSNISQDVVSIDAAKDAALKDAQKSADQVAFTKVELEYDDGTAQYDVEFYADGTEYSYTINGTTGQVMEKETEIR